MRTTLLRFRKGQHKDHCLKALVNAGKKKGLQGWVLWEAVGTALDSLDSCNGVLQRDGEVEI